MPNKKTYGFTLMELLIVIGIIIILAGLLSPALQAVREQAKIQKAKAMIASLETGVNMYYTDLGGYPPDLITLTNSFGAYGPWMDNKDVVNNNFVDPWQNPYTYNNTTASIWSNGPNGVNNNGNPDDISN